LPKGCGISNFGATKIFLELGSHINVDKEIERLTKKLNEQLGFIENLFRRLPNGIKNYTLGNTKD